MSILTVILILIALIIIIPLTVALFSPKEVVIEKEITINKPKQDVFNYVKLLKNQNNYNAWVMMDPDSKKTYTGTDGTVGFISTWDSTHKQVGKGEQEIKKIIEGERIDIEIRFMKPQQNVAQSYMTTQAVSAKQTKVHWVFIGNRTYIMRVMYLVLNLRKMLEKNFESGLVNLKNILEKQSG